MLFKRNPFLQLKICSAELSQDGLIIQASTDNEQSFVATDVQKCAFNLVFYRNVTNYQ